MGWWLPAGALRSKTNPPPRLRPFELGWKIWDWRWNCEPETENSRAETEGGGHDQAPTRGQGENKKYSRIYWDEKFHKGGGGGFLEHPRITYLSKQCSPTQNIIPGAE